MSQQLAPGRARLGGVTRRGAPAFGLRPTVRFAIAVVPHRRLCGVRRLVVSAPWRSELREAIGPVMAWVIPTLARLRPGASLIGFLVFTLILTPLPGLRACTRRAAVAGR